jgi:hypothetical protein
MPLVKGRYPTYRLRAEDLRKYLESLFPKDRGKIIVEVGGPTKPA